MFQRKKICQFFVLFWGITLFGLLLAGLQPASAHYYKFVKPPHHFKHFHHPVKPKHNEITKAEFVAEITEFFGWPHPDDYNDVWKSEPKKFNDVETNDRYGKLIEAAYEEGIIESDEAGNFHPYSALTYAEALEILAEAFKVPESTIMPIVMDRKHYGQEDLMKRRDFFKIFDELKETFVAPAYALPRQNYSAPRRYVKLYTATPGATIYFTTDGSEPTTASDIYTVYDKGHINESLSTDQLPERDVIYKAITVKDGLIASPVQTFTWHLYRPVTAPYDSQLILEGTSTSPTVYQIYNDSESVRAMAWYIEGRDQGLLFDALQTNPGDSNPNLVTYIQDNLATKPFFLVVGHEHGDHIAQAPNFLAAGLKVYLNKRGWQSASRASWFPAVFPTAEEQAMVSDVEEGDFFDLGGCKLDVYAMPGHANGNIVLQDKENGLIFSSDIYGCTRAGSADNVGVSGLRVDRLLSFTQQTYSNYKKGGGKTTMLFTGHDESALSDANLKLFEAALQQVVDKGEAGCSPTLRGNNNAPYARTTLIGDMWKDNTNWIALLIGGIMGDDYEYLTSNPINSDGEVTPINYNGDGGFLQYSVLSNIEIEGGELEGVDVSWADAQSFQWAGETITVENALPNKFDPWTYDYTIVVPKENRRGLITIIPTTMSTKVKSIRLNGKRVGYRSRNTLRVKDGSMITIEVVAPDRTTTSTYTFFIVREY